MLKLTCQGHRITGDMEDRLRYHMQERDARKWWEIKLRVPQLYTGRVDWKVYEENRKKTPKWMNTRCDQG